MNDEKTIAENISELQKKIKVEYKIYERLKKSKSDMERQKSAPEVFDFISHLENILDTMVKIKTQRDAEWLEKISKLPIIRISGRDRLHNIVDITGVDRFGLWKIRDISKPEKWNIDYIAVSYNNLYDLIKELKSAMKVKK